MAPEHGETQAQNEAEALLVPPPAHEHWWEKGKTDKAPQLTADEVEAVEDSIGTVALLRMEDGSIDFNRQDLSLETNFDVPEELSTKINSKFVNMRTLMYGYLAHHDGLYITPEGEAHRYMGSDKKGNHRLTAKPAHKP